jgi:hypothetical protein
MGGALKSSWMYLEILHEINRPAIVDIASSRFCKPGIGKRIHGDCIR